MGSGNLKSGKDFQVSVGNYIKEDHYYHIHWDSRSSSTTFVIRLNTMPGSPSLAKRGDTEAAILKTVAIKPRKGQREHHEDCPSKSP